MLQYIRNSNKKVIVVMTKIDKLSRNELQKNINMIKKELQLTENDVLVQFSSLKKLGREELLEKIGEYI